MKGLNKMSSKYKDAYIIIHDGNFVGLQLKKRKPMNVLKC